MNKQRVNEIAKTILSQLFETPSTVFSWGAHNFAAVVYKEQPSLIFTVHGFLHTGMVVVSYNEGADTYSVYTIKPDGQVDKYCTPVFFDTLASTIDGFVERSPLWTDAEYNDKIRDYLKSK